MKIRVNRGTAPAQLSGHAYTLSLPGNSVLPFTENTPQPGKLFKSLKLKVHANIKAESVTVLHFGHFILIYTVQLVFYK